MSPVMTPVVLCGAISTAVTTGDWFKKLRRANASTAHANGDCAGGAVGDDAMNGLTIAPMKPVTTLLMMSTGPAGASATGDEGACLVAVDCGAVALVSVADDLDNAATGVVLAVLSAGRVVLGEDRRVVLATI